MSEQVEPISQAFRVSHYSTLGVAEHATQEQIRDAYRRAVQRCHPDRFQQEPHAEVAFKEITAAYKVLRDERSRRDYDRRLGLAPDRGEQVVEERAHQGNEVRDDDEDQVGASDLQELERSAEAYARSGIGALKIASNLIAEGSPYAVAWHLAWRARRGFLARSLQGVTDDYASSHLGPRTEADRPRDEAVAPGRAKWGSERDRQRRFASVWSRLKTPNAR